MTAERTLYAGIDIGSLSTDVVLLDGNLAVVGSAITATGASTRKAAREALDAALRAGGATEREIAFTVATGYGRESAEGADLRVTEITCHARGARRLFPGALTVLDIGGQDCKVIRLGPDGKVADFVMNDKCAAGTGRFLEVMARTLEMDLERMGERSLLATRSLSVSSTCTVFAESEVVSLIASGAAPEEIAWGVHLAISERIAALADRLGMAPPAVLTGGVAKNPAARKALEDRFRIRFLVPDEPQLTGALGAALIAFERSSSSH
ncbi:acyl-CoA dehydratase activase [Candidatus Deferrimicrobium sp.]|uniref:acyl-CoA dehydratase activase n=1 Tax=Candidatus Deferrimicrobium sp. TaxID=3060586 RepID=UPI002EDA7817